MKFDPVEVGAYPSLIYPAYKSTVKRGPQQASLRISDTVPTQRPLSIPESLVLPHDLDLTAHGKSQPLGEKIVVTGSVLDEDGKPVRDSLIEVWQANASGRYWHERDKHEAPLDPNFFGVGKMLTDAHGRYRFITIKPGAYPWGNHDKAWRPAHIHFSLFGRVYAQRLVTQMYFPSDPLLAYDPIYQSISDLTARERLVSRFSIDETVGGEMLGYEFDIVLRGREATPFKFDI